LSDKLYESEIEIYGIDFVIGQKNEVSILLATCDVSVLQEQHIKIIINVGQPL